VDEAAFWQWAQTYRPYLKGVATKILATRAAGAVDASDIVQTALEAALRRFPQFRGKTLLEWQAFLTAIVRHKALNVVGRPSPEALRAAGDGELAQIPGDDSSPSSQASRRELAARALATMNRLEGRSRDALWMWFFEDLDHDQIAQRLQISAAASRKLRERALKELRQNWGDET
jgi:RNA polymerase sigma factor (sigma-70 family)